MTTIEIVEATGREEEWDSYVERAPNATPFHQYVALELLADHGDADLRPLVAYKGQEPVGLLPVFETKRWTFTEARSPLPSSELMYLGPLRLNVEGRKQRKAEADHRRFVDACWDWVETTIEPDLVDIRCGPRYADVRPYLWNGFDASPSYVYVVDLAPGRDALFDGLNKETRRRIRNADDDAYEIVEGEVEDTRTIGSQVRERYEEQGKRYGLTPAFLAAFHDELPDGQVRSHCLRTDGDVVAGLITVEFDDTVHVWQGGATTDLDIPVNELLYWHVIERAVSNDLDRVDLTTAMKPSLADYKAKFGPEPRPLFRVRWRSSARQLAGISYKHLPERGRELIRS